MRTRAVRDGGEVRTRAVQDGEHVTADGGNITRELGVTTFSFQSAYLPVFKLLSMNRYMGHINAYFKEK